MPASIDPSVRPPVRVLKSVRSPQLGNRRDIHVYLPESYGHGRRYPVVYMQDGQNLSDPRTALAGTWNLDQALELLRGRGVEPIVVGIPHMGPKRVDEYSPFRDTKVGGGGGDDYVAFLVETLKPLVDRRFRTSRIHEETGIFGSSMGGLISLYAFFRHPEVFGFVGAMSPSLWFGGGAIVEVARAAVRCDGRIYLDAGTAEGEATLRNVRRMRRLLTSKGYRLDRTLRCLEDTGGRHSEADWARRLAPALAFLLGKDQTLAGPDKLVAGKTIRS